MSKKDLSQAPQAGTSIPPEAALLANNLDQPPGPNSEELAGLFPPSFRGLTPAKPPSSEPKPRLPSLDKFQQLKQTVTKRLSSLDAGWLDRCQGAELHPAKGLEEDGCPGEISATALGSPEHKTLETLPVPQSGERELERYHNSPEGPYPEDLLNRKAVCQPPGPKCVQKSQTVDTIPSKEGRSLALSVSPTVKPIQNNSVVSQQVEIQLLEGRAESVLSEAEDSQRPNKRKKASCRKNLQETVAHKDGGMDSSKGGSSGMKRKRATEVASENPAKKQRGSKKQGLSEYDFDCQDTTEAQEEKGAAAPIYSENLLGEVEEEYPKQSRRSCIPANRYVVIRT